MSELYMFTRYIALWGSCCPHFPSTQLSKIFIVSTAVHSATLITRAFSVPPRRPPSPPPPHHPSAILSIFSSEPCWLKYQFLFDLTSRTQHQQKKKKTNRS